MTDEQRLSEIRARLAKVREAIGGAIYERGENGTDLRSLDPGGWEWIVDELREIQTALAALDRVPPRHDCQEWREAIVGCAVCHDDYYKALDEAEARGKAARVPPRGGGEPSAAIERDCPHCDGRGWYPEADRATGDPVQVQCAFCVGMGKLYVLARGDTGARGAGQ